ncbi:DNA/RNA non-specific endonuclease [Methylobacterium nonmethylotrophicum]|uniref:Nuclease n=1 Tax=Methylobacterium nonmethylotrophicum TaxID=1141884 RepID=A0A4Z0NWA6_9HYPH|nr:DNA/RNA non-specific endonuclease [Methylobacterium nonmethylotrophicum]TGE00743.1 nuclease [Methylobacterium nonmethylotrophicum]
MADHDSHEEARGRLESLFSGIPGAREAVAEAIASGQIDPTRFRVNQADLGTRLEHVGNPLGLEAIIRRVVRPPMLIRNDRVEFVPVPKFPELTEAHVRRVERFIPSVGRVEFVNHSMRWGGTGFVIDGAGRGRRRVVTNRHVAKLVARRGRTGAGVFLRSPIGMPYRAKLDMREEVDSKPGTAFELPVSTIVYLADDTEADVALLEIEVNDRLAPDPIPLAGRRANDAELVATVGYPAFDDRNDLAEMREYFQDLFDVKRFAPGLVMTSGAGTVLSHDCTTLGGNSGSCLISLEQEGVVGLHFSGEFGVENAAVSVETLKRLLASGSLVALPGAAAPADVESRSDGEHDADDLKDRGGYDPDFLGEGLAVPWPDLDAGIGDDLAQPSDALPGRPYELRYTHFGVLFSKSRRSPRVTAVNIDGEESVRIKRRDDRWFYDLRIPRELQLGQNAYEDPDIDRGHMVRREDPNWGDDAQQANDDTFHYTNSALQHSSLNQGKTLWQGLENYILDSSRTKGFKACVFTGPVFDDEDPELPPSNAQVPQEFWKIVAMPAEGGGLHATAYLLSQGDLIRRLLLKRSRNEAAEGFVLGPYRTFQVAITHIEEVTGLSFPALRGADPLSRTLRAQEALADGRPAYIPLESAEDLVLAAAGETAPGDAGEAGSEDEALAEVASRVAQFPPPTLLQRLVELQDGTGDPGQAAEVGELLRAYQAAVASYPSREEGPAPSYASLKPDYETLFASCQVRPERAGEVAWHVKKLRAYQARYEAVGDKLGIPWWFVGITHALEGSFNFNGHLHNGDPLTARTVQIPKGRPKVWNPPNDWESSAVDALTMKGYAGQEDWSVPRALYRFEAYNGWGYRGRGVHTPYLWSFSTHYTRGKFVKDKVYDANAVSKQCGAAVMLKALGV